jgi:hypothetical protein
MEQVFPLPIPQAKGPRAHRGHGPGLRGEDRRAVTGRKAEVPIEVGALEGKRRMALGDADGALVGGPFRALRQGAVHQKPGAGAAPEPAAQLELQLAPRPIERPRRLHEVADGMGRLVLRQPQSGEVLERVARGRQCSRPGDHDPAPVLHYGAETRVASLPHGGGDLGDVDRGRASVGDQMHALDAVEEGERIRPRLRRAKGAAPERGVLDQPGRPDARLLGPATAGLRDCGRGRQAPHGESPAKRRQSRVVRGHSSSNAVNGGTFVIQRPASPPIWSIST